MSTEADEGSPSVGAAAEVLGRITAVVPVPTGFEPLQTFEQHDAERRGISVSGHLGGGDLTAALDRLEAAMTADGWELVNRTNLGDQILSLHLERDGAAVNVNAAAEGDEAMLTLMLLEGT